jgi:hypothetical protein
MVHISDGACEVPSTQVCFVPVPSRCFSLSTAMPRRQRSSHIKQRENAICALGAVSSSDNLHVKYQLSCEVRGGHCLVPIFIYERNVGTLARA